MEEIRQSGFTLIELLLTLAIIAVLTAISAPAMSGFLDRARLRAATDAITQELLLARNHALTHHRPIYISVRNAAQNSWCIGWGTQPACNCFSSAIETACSTEGRQRVRHSVQLPNIQIATNIGSRAFRFSPVRGTANAGTIFVTGTAGTTKVIVSPLGRVRICSTDFSRYRSC